jgi:hypothetical protein
MLILDVKTRWSSTHQMLRELKLIVYSSLSEIWVGRALDYREAIDSFVAKTRDLRAFELAPSDWDAVILVTGWLKSFRSATTQMSTTKRATLSFTHAIFRGLQESVRQSLRDLPADCEPHLKQSILLAHRKLSDYYYKFDESPLYIWASSMFLSHFLHPRLTFLQSLTPVSRLMDYLLTAMEMTTLSVISTRLVLYSKASTMRATRSRLYLRQQRQRPLGLLHHPAALC